MKISQIVPFLAAATLTGMSASAQITYLTQDRHIDVHAEGPEGSNPVSASDTAIDFGPFAISPISVFGGGEVDGGGALADEYSTLEGWGMSYSGFVDAFTYGSGAFAASRSYFSVEFSVNTPTGYSLNGYLNNLFEEQPLVEGVARLALGNSASIRLYENDNIVTELLGAGPIDGSGTLMPGSTYRLTADLSAMANQIYGDNMWNGQVYLQTTSPVPEAGTTAAGFALVGLGVWQWRRRRA